MPDNQTPASKPAQAVPKVRDPQAWRYQRCPMCDSRPASELQAMQKFCHSCNTYYHKG